jgi:hypothetical protein
VAGWIDIVFEEATKRWAGRKALVLSQIPGLLRYAGITSEEVIANRSLREALATEGGEKLQLVFDPDHPLVWGVVPASAKLTLEEQRAAFRRDTSKPPPPPRFKRGFWTAFIKRIDDGQRRLVNLNEGGFVDLPKTTMSPPNSQEVLPTDIVQEDVLKELNRDEHIFERVKRWLERHQLKAEDFYVDAQTPTQAKEDPASLVRLDKLSEGDLQRIMVPMDIVMKLLRRQS